MLNSNSSITLQKGIVYLTYGSIEQIKWLTQDIPLELVLLHNPTSQTIRQTLEHSVDVLGNVDKKIYILLPSDKLEASIVLKRKEGKKRATRCPSESNHAIPIEEDFVYNQESYIFVIVSEVDGEAREDIDVKSLTCDPRFLSLKLNNLNCNNEDNSGSDIDQRSKDPALAKILEYNKDVPFTVESKLSIYKTVKESIPDLTYADVGLYESPEEHTKGRVQELCAALRDKEGYKKWRGITHKEYIELLIGHKVRNNIPLLLLGGITGLSEYLLPFTQQIESSKVRYSSVPLESFAIWVYMCERYWPPSKGGTWYKGEAGYSYFKCSSQGLEAWEILTAQGLDIDNHKMLNAPIKSKI